MGTARPMPMSLRLGAALAALLVAAPAMAGALPFDGAFGNTEGCALYSAGKIPNGQGQFFLLTANTFASYPVSCDFRSAVASGSLGLLANAACHTETDNDVEMVRLIDHGAEGYGIKFDGLDELGPFPACSPKQPGVPTGKLPQ